VEEILAQTPGAKNPDGSANLNARRCAVEIVLADMTDFLTDLHPERPNDLPKPKRGRPAGRQ
jgi:hypothetical protein